MAKMKISAEIDVSFDAGESADLEVIDEGEINDEIAAAVAGCAGIENVASVTVKRLKIS